MRTIAAFIASASGVVSPDTLDAFAETTVIEEVLRVKEPLAALAIGAVTTDIRPKPNAETATSAMRLSVVFVDIDFLSLVVKKTFSSTAGKE